MQNISILGEGRKYKNQADKNPKINCFHVRNLGCKAPKNVKVFVENALQCYNNFQKQMLLQT
mgnify:CR=1 FL=1